jgi:membrane associated rhomboid family serine protease
MRIFGSVGLMVTGFILLLSGFFVPFLMMIKVLEPSFLLMFFGYTASVGGLIMGVVGSALFVRERQE